LKIIGPHDFAIHNTTELMQLLAPSSS